MLEKINEEKICDGMSDYGFRFFMNVSNVDNLLFGILCL